MVHFVGKTLTVDCGSSLNGHDKRAGATGSVGKCLLPIADCCLTKLAVNPFTKVRHPGPSGRKPNSMFYKVTQCT